jgi:hypothetical protein
VPHMRHPPLEKLWALKAVSAPPTTTQPQVLDPQITNRVMDTRDVTSGEFRSASPIRSIDAKRAPMPW